MEQNDHLLFVAGLVPGIADDQRRCKQVLFLQRVRVHPVRAGLTHGEMEVSISLRPYERLRRATHTVGWPWRCQTVPMDDGGFGGPVLEDNVEWITSHELQPAQTAGAFQPENGSRPAIHFNRALVDVEHPVTGVRRPRMAWKNACLSKS